MSNTIICPNDIDEIYQGEELYIGGCVYDDSGDAMDISAATIIAQVTSRNGYRITFSTDKNGGIIKEPDKGVFSFVISGNETLTLRGLYFIAFSVSMNGHVLSSDQYKAFEVKQSNISSK